MTELSIPFEALRLSAPVVTSVALAQGTSGEVVVAVDLRGSGIQAGDRALLWWAEAFQKEMIVFPSTVRNGILEFKIENEKLDYSEGGKLRYSISRAIDSPSTSIDKTA